MPPRPPIPPLAASSFLLILTACQQPADPAEPTRVEPASELRSEPSAPAEPSPEELLGVVEALGDRPRLVRSWATGEVSALELDRQGGEVLVGTRAGEITLWQLPEALLERRWQGAPEGASGPVVGVGHWWSHVWAVFDIDGELWLVDLAGDRVADRVPTPPSGVQRVVFPRDSEQLLLRLGDGYAGWTPPEGALVPLDRPPSALDPEQEQRRFAAAGLDATQELSTRTGRGVSFGALGEHPLRLSEDGRSLVGVLEDRLGLWELTAPRGVERWEGEGPVLRLGFAARDLLVAVDRGERGVQLRDAVTGLALGALEQAVPAWDPFAVVAEETPLATLPRVSAAARSADGRWLLTADEAGGLRRWDLDALRQGRILDTRLDRMLRAAPYSSDTLLARAEVAALAGRWDKVADLLELAENQGAAVHPARRLRALALAGRPGGARELLERIGPAFQDDPAVRAWAHWLEARPAR